MKYVENKAYNCDFTISQYQIVLSQSDFSMTYFIQISSLHNYDTTCKYNEMNYRWQVVGISPASYADVLS